MADEDGRDMMLSKDPVARLIWVMARLRDPDGGCPWDLEQDFASIAPYTIEEAYEVADAIARGHEDDLRKELGDLLFQVVYHARMAEERGWFRFEDVAVAITDKMITRHPHVFGDDAGRDAGLNAERQSTNWETQKQREREARAAADGGRAHVLADVPLALPSLKRAQKLQSRAARVGFDWPNAQGALAKVREEAAEVEQALSASPRDAAAIEEEIGDLLFAAVNLGRHAGVDTETALQAANRKFERRFAAMEDALAVDGLKPEQVDLERLEALWQAAKRQES